VIVLLLAGFFDGVAGNPVHAMVLVIAAGLLVWRPADPSPTDGRGSSARPLWEWSKTCLRPRWMPIAVSTAAAFAIVVGGLERYSWPVTVSVIVPGVIALLIARSTPEAAGPDPEIDRTGTALWIAVFVGIAIWELVNFVLQPDRLTGSYDHPTLSTLFNTYATGHAGQSLALFLWLAIGWWLVER
jgi:hypothetical protein